MAWIEYFCVHGPGDVRNQPVRHGDEYSEFIADCYALDGNGRMLYDSAFISRPKGCDKSGLNGRIALFEAFGPCRFDGFAEGGEVYRDPWGLGFEYRYAKGEPMGRPVQDPFIRCMATEEEQTGHVYDVIYVNLTEGNPLSRVPGVDPGLTRTFLPGGGEIRPSTASSASKDGGKETFIAFDETHLYNRPELRRMYDTSTRNLRKRKKFAQTWYLETTTMFAAGEDSVAESTYVLAEQIREGVTRRERLLFDHRYGECENLADEAALRAALVEAFGDALEWNDLESLVDEFYDPRKAPADSRRYFLNAATSASDAWLTEPEVAGCLDVTKVIADRDTITLGFDGSRHRSRGVTDATALIGCRLSDGHLFQIAVWEQPSGPLGEDWEIPRSEADAAVREAFKRWRVVGFYADPAKWESHISAWEAAFHQQLKVRVSAAHPVHWWMTGGRATFTVRALEKFRNAVVDKQLTHDGSYALVRHLLNARRRVSRNGLQIGKEHPDSSRKIDAAVAAVLAWNARLDALAAGVVDQPARYAPKRIR